MASWFYLIPFVALSPLSLINFLILACDTFSRSTIDLSSLSSFLAIASFNFYISCIIFINFSSLLLFSLAANSPLLAPPSSFTATVSYLIIISFIGSLSLDLSVLSLSKLFFVAGLYEKVSMSYSRSFLISHLISSMRSGGSGSFSINLFSCF